MADSLGTIYGKPLIRDLRTTPDVALKKIRQDILRRIRKKLIQSTFSERAKKSLAQALRVKMGPSSLTIESNHPAFVLLLKGQRKQQMTWLTKARAPIPIITETGELIFRWATPRSMKAGKWIHPGRPPYDFLEKAKEEAKAAVKKRLIEEFRRIAQRASAEGARKSKRR